MKKIVILVVVCLLSVATVFGQSKRKWEEVQDANSISSYQEFINQYPVGKFTELAKQQLAILQKLKIVEDSIKKVKIVEALVIGEKIVPGISIEKVLSLLSIEEISPIIFSTGVKGFTGTAKLCGFDLVFEKGIVVSKKIIENDLGTGRCESHTFIKPIKN
jgi:hypothetical protein